MSDEYPDYEDEEEGDDYDEYTDNSSVKNASIIGQLSGDAFGNQADYLWKCRKCSGLFVAARHNSFTVIVGTIMYFEPEETIRERVAGLWDRYNKAAKERNICACENRGELFTWSGSPSRGLFRQLSAEDFEDSDLVEDEDESDSDPS